MNNDNYSEQIIDAAARILLPLIREFYESEEGRQMFERWMEENGEKGGDE